MKSVKTTNSSFDDNINDNNYLNEVPLAVIVNKFPINYISDEISSLI